MELESSNTVAHTTFETPEVLSNENKQFGTKSCSIEEENTNISYNKIQDETEDHALGNSHLAQESQAAMDTAIVNSNICSSEISSSVQKVQSKDINNDPQQVTELSRKTEQIQGSNVESSKALLKKQSLTVLDNSSASESESNCEFEKDVTSITSNNTTEHELKNLELSVKMKKRISILDTDSESEDIPHKSFNSDIVIGNHTKEQHSGQFCLNDDTKPESTYDINHTLDETEPVVENDNIHSNTSLVNSKSGSRNIVQKSRLALLCDSDSDEERCNDQPDSPQDDMVEQSQHARDVNTKSRTPWLSKNTAPSSMKKSKIKTLSEEPKKITAKEAAELRKEIQSESQRMMRERNISLPYHKPKAHSLKEFLARRPRFSATVPTDPAPASVAIKMSTEQLELVSKRLKEREKEVKEFYKSESESENDDDEDYVPPANNTKNDGTTQNNGDHVNYATRGEDGGNIINDLEDVTRTSIKDNGSQEETNEEPKKDLQDTEDLLNDIHNSGDILEISKETVVKATETADVEEPNETEYLPRTSEYESDTGEHQKGTDVCKSTNQNIVPRSSTESYDFHLDDENTEIVSIDNLDINQAPTKPFAYTDLDMEIENFGNLDNRHSIIEENPCDKPVSPPVKSKLDILKQRLSNITPKLSGGPDKVIDLDSAVVKPKEVVELMERFTKHIFKKHQSKHKVKLSIITVESGGDIHKETVAVNVDSDNETEVHEEKPGAKLQKLREELQKQMDQRKSDIWQQKAAKGIRGCESHKDGEHNGEEYDDDDSMYYDEDEEEEAEMTEEENSEEELENDVDLSDKPIRKSAFLDQEAEESGEEDTLDKDGYEEGILNEEEAIEQSKAINDDEDSNMVNEQTPSEHSKAENESLVTKKKVLKRILTPDDDSDDDMFSDCVTQQTTPIEHLDSTVTADEDDIPPHQTRQLQTPMRHAISQAKSISDFLTPISFITSIQNLASANKINKNEPAISPFRMPRDQSPVTIEKSTAVSQKKLFADSELADSQESFDVAVEQTQESLSNSEQNNEMCSLQGTQLENNDEPPNTQDLIGICSGEFTGVTQLEPSDETRKIMVDDSQSSEHKELGTDQDMIISQLLDEEELENFKKKFESPVNSHTPRETQEITGGGIIDSDDEDKEEYGLRKKKNLRIQFSDDDSSDEEKNGSDEEIDLQDNDMIYEEVDNIGYDSEENEIDLNSIGKKEKMKMGDFFEAEAELSESEWGSEDEDENDMDKLEFELGDTDKFDEEQVKEDLEKIHLRRMLDDDAREVKLLQEVLLEDGEMHGTGRQRQFKWKNIGTDQDMIISQLLDEEELENFKKKFESPVNSHTPRETQEITGGGIIDSDDEDKEEYGLRKKKNLRIQFSDDDSSDEEKNGSDEEIDLQDNDMIYEEVDNIGYDSEENEIDLNSIGKKEKMKMGDFFEAEAELSESEWGSEDEDENDMDKLEFELGDTDKFDEEQVKEDLEKIHLRRMLDDDAREVKLLQEVLLEDGEMHGTGRQRQFKWKNIDINGDQIEEKKDDDEIYSDEEESEEHWRKKRHEREMFLQEKQHKSQNLELDDQDFLNHSQLLKIGQKVLQRSQGQNSSQNNTPIEESNDSPVSKISLNLLSKRGSFLSRGDLVLKRVAEYTRTTTDLSVTSTKTTKNFVFQSISSSGESVIPAGDKKRKASDGTPNVLKKLRLNTTLSPAVKKTEKARKLFNF